MSLKDRILETCELKDIVAEVVKLRAVNQHQLGLCPFHEEKTPSFYVYPDHYHCYGCHAHGDVIAFVMKHYRLEFVEALRWLARKAGLDDSELNKKTSRVVAARQHHTLTLMTAAQQFFNSSLWESTSASSRQAKEYICARGFAEDFLQDHGFGYCPPGGMDLLMHLSKLGYSQKDLESASLVARAVRPPRRGGASVYDFFKARLTLPIHNHSGQLIAFSGRWVGRTESHQAKYKNSRYAKNQILYGLHWAKSAIQQTQRVLITEGYMDALRLRSRGWLETVACQGTALSRMHLKALARYARHIILLFDGDAAGEAAAMRVIPLSLQYPHLKFSLVRLPKGHDPDSFVQEHAAAEVEAFIGGAKPLFSAVIADKIATSTPEALLAMVQTEFLPWIKSLPSSLQQDLLMHQLAEHSGLSYAALAQELKQLTSKAFSVAAVAPATDQEALAQADLQSLTPLWAEFVTQIYLAIPEDQIDTDAISTFVAGDIRLHATWIEFIQDCLAALNSSQPPQEYLRSQHLVDPSLMDQLNTMVRRYATAHRREAIEQLMLCYHMDHINAQLRDLHVALKRERELTPVEDGRSEHWVSIARTIQDLRSQYLVHHKKWLAHKKKLATAPAATTLSSAEFTAALPLISRAHPVGSGELTR